MRASLFRTAAILVAVAALLLGSASTGAAAAPYCGIRWGSLEKASGSGPTFPPSPITGVRSGRHTCYDRLVIDLRGSAVGYRVRYVPVVTTQATGDAVALRGGAFLDVTVYAPTYDDAGAPTVWFNPTEVVPVGSYRTFRQVASAGSFEGYTTFGLGVRARLPFRVFTLAGPGSGSRIVIDVAHRW